MDRPYFVMKKVFFCYVGMTGAQLFSLVARDIFLTFLSPQILHRQWPRIRPLSSVLSGPAEMERDMRIYGQMLALVCGAGAVQADEGMDLPLDILSRVVASDCIDVHPNPGCERITLLQSDASAADLIILPDVRNNPPYEPLLVDLDAVFSSGFGPDAPDIVASAMGGFSLTSAQSDQGRHPWSQSLTILWHEGTFVVAHFSFSAYDRADGSSYACDVDLMSGDYATSVTKVIDSGDERVTEDAGQIEPMLVPLSDWTMDITGPDVCQSASESFYAP